MIEQLKENYGFLFEEDLITEIGQVGLIKSLKRGEALMEIGSAIRYMPLLFKGSIKIVREDNDGNELLLYFLETGDTCAFSLSCCIGNKKSEIKAIIVEDTEMVLIPVQKMEEWICKYKTWKNFVFESYNLRLEEMLETIDTLAFMKMDQRLYKFLIDKVKLIGSRNIENTHQQIAHNLNTSRVVISRLLKQLENEKKIKLHRNRIEVLDF
jgi:CRP/FNR family transcriptional regulator, anaerobic regulatory protein